MDNFVYEIDNVLSPNLCINIIDKFELDDCNKVSGKLGSLNFSRIDTFSKDSVEISIPTSPGWEKAHEKIKHHFYKALDKYMDHIKKILKSAGVEEDGDLDFFMDSTFTQSHPIDFNIQKITKNKRYRWHQDTEYHTKRLFTAIIYLNTLGPDDGGKTRFVNGREIEPVAGKMVIFPATWDCAHCGQLVKSDTKYIISVNVCRCI